MQKAGNGWLQDAVVRQLFSGFMRKRQDKNANYATTQEHFLHNQHLARRLSGLGEHESMGTRATGD